MNTSVEFDIGPLTWVKDEIDLALSRAGDVLAEADDGDRDRFKTARGHLHQAQGALSIVGLAGISHFAETIEQVFAALESGTDSAGRPPPVSPQAIGICRRALKTISRYLDDLVDGVPDQPLRLLPAYRELMALLGVAEAAPTDLFFPDLALRPPRRAQEQAELDGEALMKRLKAARLGFQRGMLKWLKGDEQGERGLTEMRNSLAVIEATQIQPAARSFWWISLAFLDALAAGGIPVDAAVKRLCARIDAQIAKLHEGAFAVAERLFRDVLYHVATAAATNEHIENVRTVFRLGDLIPAAADVVGGDDDDDVDAADADQPLSERRARLRAMREELAVAKEEWNRHCTGDQEASALSRFFEHAALLAGQGQALGQMDLARLLAAIHAVAGMLRGNAVPGAGSDVVALEVATALLLAEQALDTFEHLGVDFARQVDAMAGRLNALLRGEAFAEPEPSPPPLLDDIARQAQTRLLTHQVAREMLGNLAVVEQCLDAFFRHPQGEAETAALRSLAAPLKQVEGALVMLGEQRAAEVLRECAIQVATFAEAMRPAEEREFEALAGKLSAIGFFVEQLQRGPADIDALLKPAPQAHAVPTVAASSDAGMQTTEIAAHFSEPAQGLGLHAEACEPTLAGDGEEADDATRESLADIGADLAEEPLEPESGPPVPLPTPAPSAEAVRLAGASSEAIDAELLAIFLEEAHEVLEASADCLQRSLAHPDDHEVLRSLRRGFHTLKGSGRMVGLTDLGETAWAVEQAMNHWLQLERDATPLLHRMLKEAQALFTGWVARLEFGTRSSSGSASPAVADLLAMCEDLRAEPRGSAMSDTEPAPVESPETEIAGSAASEAETAAGGYGEPATMPEPGAADDVVEIGGLRLSPSVYDIYLAEVRTHLDVLKHGQAEAGDTPPSPEMLRASHTLGGISATLGVLPVSSLARALEAALERFSAASVIPDEAAAEVLMQAMRKLETMLGAFSMRRMPDADADLIEQLAGLVPASEASVAEAGSMSAVEAAPEDARQKVRAQDDFDPQLLPIFLEEGMDQLREIGAALRGWREAPEDAEIPLRLQRLLHTLKGDARMAGAMQLGDLIHGIETHIEQECQSGVALTPEFLDEIEASFDRALALMDSLMQVVRPDVADMADVADAAGEIAAEGTVATQEITVAEPAAPAIAEGAAPRAHLRIRAETVDRLINEAGEIAIARSRIEGELRTLKASLLDLTENVSRLREQLREIEIQAESQMQSQLSQMQESPDQFDPLEMDRFTRFQELTRMMAENVNDVTTVQQSLLRNLDQANVAVGAQARLNRELTQSLMGVRMVPFNSIVDRLYRVVRQTAKELDKRVNLELNGAQLELDRSLLERMVGPLEHLLRNAIVHGIESRAARQVAGKAETGEIVLTLNQQGNEVAIELADDGAGLDFDGIRARAAERGLFDAERQSGRSIDERYLSQLIFMPGFSTAGALSELAGRGVGLDVVKTETLALGGRIDVSSQAGRGTRFRMFLPLTLAVTQALLVKAGNRVHALPSTMVGQVMELRPEAVEKIRAEGGTRWLDNHYPWHYLNRLLGEPALQPPPARRHWILLLRGGERHLALEVDGLSGNQEIVVKNIGAQLARVPGIAGATVLNDGAIALILNPMALVARAERLATQVGAASDPASTVSSAAAPDADSRPVIMVVDDSLTVRKLLERQLTREGYQVVMARDGVDALEQLADFVPAVILLDIEMPRMDGFGVARNVREDIRLGHVPIIMITSRTADKHRNYARELGVDAYLGKPYDEEELLRLIAGFIARQGMPDSGEG